VTRRSKVDSDTAPSSRPAMRIRARLHQLKPARAGGFNHNAMIGLVPVAALACPGHQDVSLLGVAKMIRDRATMDGMVNVRHRDKRVVMIIPFDLP
jgi:hypothetical protein